MLLDTLVKPRNKIVDYLTKYSGVTKKMLKNVDVRIEDVQVISFSSEHEFIFSLSAIRHSRPAVVASLLQGVFIFA